ncbi:hypothetical protein Dole_0227 [Desulfosudis oleivorans Hxd3]|uniref:Uncharacterized protein n=1 Tax=Desulfosudis oleivorans (strain DSM 6200 / JCM 39069 / Hxd3) TaxID=96561 RepID=A8ZS19_DESOH|nr:hypothetical protein Dole_0227 [Desulfosudis oleivorans Hxd3]
MFSVNKNLVQTRHTRSEGGLFQNVVFSIGPPFVSGYRQPVKKGRLTMFSVWSKETDMSVLLLTTMHVKNKKRVLLFYKKGVA